MLVQDKQNKSKRYSLARPTIQERRWLGLARQLGWYTRNLVTGYSIPSVCLSVTWQSHQTHTNLHSLGQHSTSASHIVTRF